jgi:hypothetical protein
VASTLDTAPLEPLPLWRYCAAGHFRGPVDLPADLVDSARLKLGETPERKREALAALRLSCEDATTRSRSTPAFVRMDDQFLLAFLRAKRFDVARAFEALANYSLLAAEVGAEDSAVRRDGGLAHSEMGQLYAMNILQLLPGIARDGSRIALVRGAAFTGELLTTLAAAAPGGRSGERIVRYLLWLFTRLISDPYVQVNGLTMVEDLAGVPLMAFVRFARGLSKGPKRRILQLVQNALPIRFNSFYMVHAPSQLSWLLWSAGPFLGRQMKERIVFASDLPRARDGSGTGEMGAVAETLGHSSLPPEFGGTLEQGALHPSWWERQCDAVDHAAVWREGVSNTEELGMRVENT